MKRSYQLSFIMLILLLFPFTAHADELSGLQETVARQQSQIDSLSQKLKDHENEDSSTFGWNLGLFGDVNYSTKSREHPHDSFYFHEISLYSSASYGDRLSFFTEIAIEDNQADIERVWAGYTFSDLLMIRAGKFHTAMGYWNKSYHHGRQLFTTVDRPFFLAFEHDGGVLPIHITGLEIEGSKALGIGRLKYEFELGNSPKIENEFHTVDASGTIETERMLDPNNASDNNSSKQPVLRVSLRPSAVQGLSVGVFATNFEVDTVTIPKTGLDETIYGVDISYAGNNFEFITEGFIFYNPDGDGNACYGQLSYTSGDWTPYARYERLEVQGGDPYFKDLPEGVDRRQTIVGLKYDIDPIRSSLKFQYRHDDATKDYDVFETQWAFHF